MLIAQSINLDFIERKYSEGSCPLGGGINIEPNRNLVCLFLSILAFMAVHIQNVHTLKYLWFKELAPQDIQKNFPDYQNLVDDLKVTNDIMIKYALELKRMVDNK